MASRVEKKPDVLVQFSLGPFWIDSYKNAAKTVVNLGQKVKEFQDCKAQNPLAPFGNNDKPFAGGAYKKLLPKARKAHLTSDYSIVYELSGRNPTIIKLIGIFSHNDLGTGQPSNQKIQQNMAKRLIKEEIADEDIS